jgi:4'-phosphopantetheinyl transferase
MQDRNRKLGPVPEPHEAIGPGEVWLWSIDTAACGEPLAALVARLVDDERAELERRAGPHRRRFVIARLALRRLIGAHLAVAPDRVAIARAPGGRPELDPGQSATLSFSLSYAGERVLIAVAEGVAVGVDIERIAPIGEQDAIVRSRFSASEISAWNRLEPGARPAAFYEAWTRKEAVLKATGAGLAYPLDRLSVTFGPHAAARVTTIEGHAAHHWRLLDIAGIAGHKAALAVGPGAGGAELVRELVLRRLPDWPATATIAARTR